MANNNVDTTNKNNNHHNIKNNNTVMIIRIRIVTKIVLPLIMTVMTDEITITQE
jgi:hypothetical protein